MRRPRVKEEPKLMPHHFSPLSEKILEENKQKVREKTRKIKKTK